MSFLDNYEDVNSRIKRFRSEFPTGRLIATIEDMDLTAGWILIKAEAYREYEDHVPSAVDFAYGNVAQLTANMRKWLIEDTTTSAYGRVIGLLSPSDKFNSRPTIQDMEKVEALPASSDPWATLTLTQTAHETGTTALATVVDLVQRELVEQSPPQTPVCKHGRMLFKSGTSAKTGKPYEGYTCSSSKRDDQCKPVWL
jgi:hypothetical protein